MTWFEVSHVWQRQLMREFIELLVYNQNIVYIEIDYIVIIKYFIIITLGLEKISNGVTGLQVLTLGLETISNELTESSLSLVTGLV